MKSLFSISVIVAGLFSAMKSQLDYSEGNFLSKRSEALKRKRMFSSFIVYQRSPAPTNRPSRRASPRPTVIATERSNRSLLRNMTYIGADAVQRVGEFLQSANGAAIAGIRADGDFLINVGTTTIWQLSSVYGVSVIPGSVAVLTGYGNFCLRTSARVIVWCCCDPSASARMSAGAAADAASNQYSLFLQNSGELLVSSVSGELIWTSRAPPPTRTPSTTTYTSRPSPRPSPYSTRPTISLSPASSALSSLFKPPPSPSPSPTPSFTRPPILTTEQQSDHSPANNSLYSSNKDFHTAHPTPRPSRQPTGGPTALSSHLLVNKQPPPSDQPTESPRHSPSSDPSSQPLVTSIPTPQPSRYPTIASSSPSFTSPSEGQQRPSSDLILTNPPIHYSIWNVSHHSPSPSPASSPASDKVYAGVGVGVESTGSKHNGDMNSSSNDDDYVAYYYSQPTGPPTNRPVISTPLPSLAVSSPSPSPSLTVDKSTSTKQLVSIPSGQPSTYPTGEPSGYPSVEPSTQPSSLPSGQPSVRPSSGPSSRPSSGPSSRPSSGPTGYPSKSPSGQPSGQPSASPSGRPSGQPSSLPSQHPTRHRHHSGQPTHVIRWEHHSAHPANTGGDAYYYEYYYDEMHGENHP